MHPSKKIFIEEFHPYLELINREILSMNGGNRVPLFYDPINYVLRLGGKRIRPLLVLLSAEMIGAGPETARFPAAAVELLHDFTLVHDDIMDNDGIRRGKPTVHVKWDMSTAILAGDGLMGLAFQKLLQTPGCDLVAMARRFTETMIVICEGQGLDKTFENQDEVSEFQYLDMIARKTAVLIELSAELGGHAAHATEKQVRLLRQFGYNLGMAFQIQDDLLDIVAEENALGKKVGSDLAKHKRTILTIKLKEKTGKEDFFKLPVSEFQTLLTDSGTLAEAEGMCRDYFDAAAAHLYQLPHNNARDRLAILSDALKKREW